MKKLKWIHLGTVLFFVVVLIFAGSCKKREVTENPASFDPHIDGVAVAPLPYLEVSHPPEIPAVSLPMKKKSRNPYLLPHPLTNRWRKKPPARHPQAQVLLIQTISLKAVA